MHLGFTVIIRRCFCSVPGCAGDGNFDFNGFHWWQFHATYLYLGNERVIKMRSNNSSGCLTAFVSSFSRIMLLIAWIARPALMNATFSSFIIPCLGFMFLPFTTLMYVFLKQGVGAIQGLDWLWLFLAALLDIASIGAAGASNRNHSCRLSWLIPAGAASAGCVRSDRSAMSGGPALPVVAGPHEMVGIRGAAPRYPPRLR